MSDTALELQAPLPLLSASRSFSQVLERRKYVVLGLLSIIYFCGTALHARSTLFWHDELFTILLSRLDFTNLCRALTAGADGNPPLLYLWTRGMDSAFGESQLWIRLPQLVGFWFFCLCLFHLVERRFGYLYGFAALFLPFGTGAYHYATDARPYGVLLGFTGAALVCWQSAAAGRRRAIALPGMALSLGGIVLCHYYGVLVFAVLGAAELWRAVIRRRPDFPMWFALAAGLVPLAACYPLIRNLGQYVSHPWSVPHIGDLYLFYKRQFENEIVSAVAFLVIAAAYFSRSRRTLKPVEAAAPVPSHEVVAWIGLAALPVVGLALAFTVTHQFADRYAIPAIAGVVLLTVTVVATISRGSTVIGGILLAASVLPFASSLLLHQAPQQNPLEGEPLLREAINGGPVAIDDGPLFLQAWYYLPPDLKSRVFYLADPAAQLEFSGSDNVDLDFQTSLPWIHMPVLPYRGAAAPGSHLRIYHSPTRWAWLPHQVLQDGARIDVVASSADREILDVSFPAANRSVAVAAQ